MNEYSVLFEITGWKDGLKCGLTRNQSDQYLKVLLQNLPDFLDKLFDGKIYIVTAESCPDNQEPLWKTP